MLKKPSGLAPPSAFLSKPATMEVESTRVQTLPDGKKMIDVTMRRTHQIRDQEKLVVPQFDDESSSSSSDEDNEPDMRLQDESTVLNKLAIIEPGERNENQSGLDTSAVGSLAGFQGKFVWNGLQDIQSLTHQNSSLNGQVHELKLQLKTLQIQLEALAPVPGLNADVVQEILLDKDSTEHDIRDTKIVHQAKALRHLKRSLQREKQLAVDAVKQFKAMEVRLSAVEKENETLTLKLARFRARASASAPLAHSGLPEEDSSASTAKEKESVGIFKKKFEDMRIKHDKLLVDLKRTQRALIREVGEDVPIEEILDASATGSEGAKRGRAQQIIMLKAKVRKLEQELSKLNGGEASSTAVADVDQRAQQELAAQHAQKQRVIDKLTSERDDLHEKVLQLAKKFDALKSRTQTLEKEKQDHKSKLQVLVDKSRNDDALVDALQRQLETWKGKIQEAKRARTAESLSMGSGGGGGLPKDERLELDRLRATVAEFRRQNSLNQSNGNGFMPPPSEAAQYRTMMAEKERFVEQVKVLQLQLEEKDKQIRSLKSTGGGENVASSLPSRIPRIVSGSSMFMSASHYPPAPPTDSSMNEVLRKNFQDAMAANEREVESLKLQIQQASREKSSDSQQEIQDLQEENEFLRQEFERLKMRYESVIKNTRAIKS